MSFEWPEIPIDDLKAPVKGSIAMGPFGSRIKKENFTEEGIPVLKGGNLHGAFVDDTDCDFLTPEKADELSSANAFKGDIVITHRGTIGQVSIIPENAKYERFIVSQSQLKVSLDRKMVNPYFVNYFLRSPLGQHRLLSYSSQVGVPAIAKASTSVRQIKVPCPDIRVQNEIVKVLKDLDDKIAKNNEINQTLEAMAQALFKSWFVDFDPVKAKMEARANGGDDEAVRHAAMTATSGKSAEELAAFHAANPEAYTELAATADLFPESLVESELGLIPEGWEVKKIEDVAERVAMGPFGSNIKVSTFVDEGVPIISGQHLHEIMLVDNGNNFITKEHAEKLKNSKVSRGDIIFTHAGSIGQVAIIPEHSAYEEYVISQRQFYLRIDSCFVSKWFILFFFKSRIGQHALLSNASQVGVPSIARPSSHLKSIEFISPALKIQTIYENTILQLMRAIGAKINENKNLSQIRDSLLPKLLSGEIDTSAFDESTVG